MSFHSRRRLVALLLAAPIAVVGLAGFGALPAPAAPLVGAEAIPAVNKASPILFHRRDTLINSTGGSVEAPSLGDAPAGFVQKVREAGATGGGSTAAQSPAGAPQGFEVRGSGLIRTSGGNAAAQSPAEVPQEFASRGSNLISTTGGNAAAQSPAGAPDGNTQVVRKAGGLAGGIEGGLRR